MGLRPLDTSAWLQVDAARPAELTLKHRLLDSAARPQVLVSQPGTEPAGAEVLSEVLAHLGGHHPGTIRTVAGGAWEDVATGLRAGGDGCHPLETAARLVQEDLCLMVECDGAWVLGAGCVCFPSRWSLPDKLGADLSAIHAPVPGYEAGLAAPVVATFDRLRVDRPVWRSNWTLIDDPGLHQPTSPPARPVDPTRVWVRVERQTLRRLERSILFTIRTYVTDLTSLLATHPDAARALRTALGGVGPDVDDYKGWHHLRPAVLDWLPR